MNPSGARLFPPQRWSRPVGVSGKSITISSTDSCQKLLFVGFEPRLESLHGGIKEPAPRDITGPVRKVQPVELKHIGQVFGAGKTEPGKNFARNVIVNHGFAEDAG